MLLECIIALIVGILTGTISGLLPGIHINLVSVFILAIPIGIFAPMTLVIFIVAMTIAHTFLDFIPSIFLGAPDEDSILAVLPGHELLLKGRGYEAVMLALYGCCLGLGIVLVFAPIFIFIVPRIFSYLSPVMFFALVFTNIYLIIKEKNSKLLAGIVFLVSGFLGLATLNLGLNQALLPLLTGLFGASSLITSIEKKEKLPKQKIVAMKIEKKEFLKPGLAAMLAAPLCSFLPALGSGQAAILGSDVVEDIKHRGFLILIGAINAVVAGLSFVAVYSIDKARTGTAVAVQKLLENFSFFNLLVIMGAILTAGVISFFLARMLARFMAGKIARINYRALSIGVLAFISLIVIIFSGWLGFLVYITASFLGLFGILSGVRRTHLMGSLMLPAIIFYLPI